VTELPDTGVDDSLALGNGSDLSDEQREIVSVAVTQRRSVNEAWGPAMRVVAAICATTDFQTEDADSVSRHPMRMTALRARVSARSTLSVNATSYGTTLE
jgi:hypothetical protein